MNPSFRFAEGMARVIGPSSPSSPATTSSSSPAISSLSSSASSSSVSASFSSSSSSSSATTASVFAPSSSAVPSSSANYSAAFPPLTRSSLSRVSPFVIGVGSKSSDVLGIKVQIHGDPSAKSIPQDLTSDSSKEVKEGSGWLYLFSSPMPKLSFIEPSICNGKKVVSISKATHELGTAIWECSLIGQFIGYAPKFIQIFNIVNSLCGRNGRVEVFPLGCESFLFKFIDKSVKNWVLERGYWHVANRP